ncbi:DUF2630 family protein [Nocardioides mangrovi]|uniref:DUF2630 family protein n=1 Tax=Nocardioides mangrovi TaxID=2874580 RepID=A0ABS7UHM6_9ACTN|nr:DUF2630 family protein [Nocardioides mangrovi]MBZ5740325.1 DUF2630 family protein [Nocardioides mangrovi]
MDDQDLLHSISEMVDREHRLRQSHEDGPPGQPARPGERQELAALEVQLDQCWDLLRQRRARRAAGEDPDGATTRTGSVVENYWQ